MFRQYAAGEFLDLAERHSLKTARPFKAKGETTRAAEKVQYPQFSRHTKPHDAPGFTVTPPRHSVAQRGEAADRELEKVAEVLPPAKSSRNCWEEVA
jgi:hypothetical protein